MDLLFRTKEESNRAQEQAFFNLNPVDRFVVFLNLIAYSGVIDPLNPGY
ncbi:hypothetical protein [Membranihabitans maritimus]|nr:hypothetical protein [Membranihabitans maritimus]